MAHDQYRTDTSNGVVLGDRPTKMGFGDLFGYILGLEHNARLLAKGKWKAVCNPLHAVEWQLTELPPLVDCDEVPAEALPWEPKVLLHWLSWQ